MIKAFQTIAAINAALESDQGAKYRGFLGQLMPLSPDAYSTENKPFRGHLGASLIGRDCDRELWYTFRWATMPSFDGRMLRLFNRGHLEEPRMVALLMTIGCEVWQVDENGKQFRVTTGYKKHFGGSLDAVVRGLPEFPDVPVLAEFKTHNDNSFKKLKEFGVSKAKWEHFVQMQIYMRDKQLDRALYMATNKNDDELHAEIVQYDAGVCEKQDKRIIKIIDANRAPGRINQSPGWHGCRFCDHKPVCHGQTAPAINCRTCTYVELRDNKKWGCGHPVAKLIGDGPDPSELTEDEQRYPECEFYIMNPGMKVSP